LTRIEGGYTVKTIEIETAVLKAALFCAAKKDIRHSLNGVFVESKNGNLFIVSTTGATMFVHQIEGGYSGDDFGFIIPRSVVESIVKTKDNVLEIAGESFSIRSELRCGSTLFTPVDGQSPNWRSAVPSHLGTTIQDSITSKFNPELVMNCYSAIATAEGKKEKGYAANLGDTGRCGIVSGDNPLTFCIVAPMRDSGIKPDWRVL
jgi:hypothetical protein